MTDFTELKKEFSEVSDFLIALGDEKRQAGYYSFAGRRSLPGCQSL